ncbi:arylamine N-acetyltransferase family protein [Aurantiacibacter gilvus]|uniref:Arylamine N-acetyltransferase n=1 Tax=Aurantiacibacter gilvus TaxID=3139141 RepID=A0ABU9IJ74_9SPHN
MECSDRLAAYLARIGLDRAPAPDAAGLLQVQAAHRQAIPFENLDVRLGREIATDSARVFAKLVEARRGGFCFEHNRLLADMLSALGFANRLLLARVLLGNPPAATPRTHCLLLVDLGGEDWIADAGFGGAYAPPMPLCDGQEAISGDGARHRLRRIGEEGSLPGSWLLERLGPRASGDGRAQSDDAWEAQFAFDLAQVAEADLALGSHWAATHPTSRFTNVTVASLCLPDGFASLVDGELSEWRADGERQQRRLGQAADYRDVLAGRFGLDLSESEVAALPPFADRQAG